jgi:hypothetical protein
VPRGETTCYPTLTFQVQRGTYVLALLEVKSTTFLWG